MAVALDSNATTDITGSGVTTLDLTTLTVGSGSNRALVAQVAFNLKTVSAVTVTWDPATTNQTVAQIVTANGTGTDGRADLYGLVAPTSGAKTLRVSWTSSSDVVLNAVAWTGVDQTGGVTSFPHSTSATGTSVTPSVTITSAVNNATMDCSANPASGLYASPSKTQTFSDFNGNVVAGGSRAAGAASNTHSWTITSQPWVSVGTDIAQVSVATTGDEVFHHDQQPIGAQSTKLVM